MKEHTDANETGDDAQSSKQTTDDTERTEEQSYLLMRHIYTNDEYDLTFEDRTDACRTKTCPSRIHVRDMISERGIATLCRDCRQQLAEVGA